MATTRPELLEASDDVIEDAVSFGDPTVLLGVLYQLTGDQELRSMAIGADGNGMLGRSAPAVTDVRQIAKIRAKAVEFLKSYRDSGAGELSIGPSERLKESMSLIAGEEIADVEMPLWLEYLAVDPFARGLVWSKEPPRKRLEDFLVIVIGAGMGGLNASVQLSHAGISFTVLEKNAGVGGTWYENRYPGARVDTPSRSYTHVFSANYVYPSPFCRQSENEKYMNWIADRFEVRKNIQFHTEVTSILWDEADKRWVVTAEGPEGEKILRANAVITCVGFLSRPYVPEIAGLKDFGGRAFHSARWPSDVDTAGKRVAVIGTGASGYQLTTEIARDTDHLFLFQRTPSWVFEVPGYLSDYPPQVNWLDRNFPFVQNFVRFRNAWMSRPGAISAISDVDPNFKDPDVDAEGMPYAISEANKAIRDARIAYMHAKLGDEELVKKMTPPCPVGSQRPVIMDPDYNIYDVLMHDNVTLVSDGIERITTNGILTRDGTEHAVDIIVLATGFHANDYLWPMEVRGRGGAKVQDLWAKDGARAYVGCMLPGFPNFFMLYGPNTNGNVGSLSIHIQELVTRFALECLDALINQAKETVETTADAYWSYNASLDKAQATKAYLDPRAHNYYQNEFGRGATNNPHDVRLMWHWLRDPSEPGREREHLNEQLVEASLVIEPYFGKDLILK